MRESTPIILKLILFIHLDQRLFHEFVDTEALGRVRLQATLEKVFHMLTVLGPDWLAEVEHITYIAVH